MDIPDEMEAAIRHFASMIEAGEYDALEPYLRTDLRTFAMVVASFIEPVRERFAESDELLRMLCGGVLPREMQVARRGVA